MRDIILNTEDLVFSYRVAGILIHNNKILQQKPMKEDGYSFPHPTWCVQYGKKAFLALCRGIFDNKWLFFTVKGWFTWIRRK
jgi:hypothetical protein